MNPVLMIVFNNLELTKKAVASVLSQDIPVALWVVDNGSTDGTWEWISGQPVAAATHKDKNESVVKLANEMAAMLFTRAEYILGVPNDVVLPSNCYSEMLKWPRGFVCASDNGQNDPILRPATAVSENTPMGVMLTRKWAYEAMISTYGHLYDPSFVHYASDCDLALRMAACGIRGVQLDLCYWHYGSASHRLASPEVGKAMTDRADTDRAYFEKKWGFRVDSLEYGKRPADPNFRGIE